MRRKTKVEKNVQEKMAEVLLGGKRLTELKVTELKAELDKRSLPKKGVKSVLVQRLKNAILKEALTQVSVFHSRVSLWDLCGVPFLSQPEEPDSGEEEDGDDSIVNTSQVNVV